MQCTGIQPSRLTEDSVALPVLQMLDRAEQLRQGASAGRVTEPMLDLALLDTADERLKGMLTLWAGEDRIERLQKQLQRKLRDSHLERLHAGGEDTLKSSADHLAILAGLSSVGDKLDSIAEEIIREM